MTHLIRATSAGEILDASGRVVARVVPVDALEWLHGEGEEFECPPSGVRKAMPLLPATGSLNSTRMMPFSNCSLVRRSPPLPGRQTIEPFFTM